MNEEYWDVYVPEECCPGKWMRLGRYHYYGCVQTIISQGRDTKGLVIRPTLVQHFKVSYDHRIEMKAWSNG